MYEDLIIHYLETDFKKQGLPKEVFREEQARQAAIDKGLFKRQDENYVLIRLKKTEKENLCKDYFFKDRI